MEKLTLMAGWAGVGLLLLLYIPIHLYLAYRKKKPVHHTTVAPKYSIEKMHAIVTNAGSGVEELIHVVDSMVAYYPISKDKKPEDKKLLDIVFLLAAHNHADDGLVNGMLQKMMERNPHFEKEFKKAMR